MSSLPGPSTPGRETSVLGRPTRATSETLVPCLGARPDGGRTVTRRVLLGRIRVFLVPLGAWGSWGKGRRVERERAQSTAGLSPRQGRLSHPTRSLPDIVQGAPWVSLVGRTVVRVVVGGLPDTCLSLREWHRKFREGRRELEGQVGGPDVEWRWTCGSQTGSVVLPHDRRDGDEHNPRGRAREKGTPGRKGSSEGWETDRRRTFSRRDGTYSRDRTNGPKRVLDTQEVPGSPFLRTRRNTPTVRQVSVVSLRPMWPLWTVTRGWDGYSYLQW